MYRDWKKFEFFPKKNCIIGSNVLTVHARATCFYTDACAVLFNKHLGTYYDDKWFPWFKTINFFSLATRKKNAK